MKELVYLFFSFAFLFTFGVSSVQATTYAEGTLLTSPEHTSVYQVRNGKRSAFVTGELFRTWHTSFDGLLEISVEALEAVELGEPMPVKANTKLIKFPLNPKVYAVTSDEYIQHIPDVETARAMFGDGWNDDIIHLPELYYLFYTKGPALPHMDRVVETAPIESTDSTTLGLRTSDCGGHADYTKYIREYEPKNEYFGFCVPSYLTFAIDHPLRQQVNGEIAGESFELIWTGESRSSMTLEAYIAQKSDPIFSNYDIETRVLDSGNTIITHKYTKPEGILVSTIQIVEEETDQLRVFFMSFADRDIESHASTISEVQTALEETLVFFD